MHKLEKHIQNLLQKHPAKTYFVACSGGVDSVVMFSVVKKLNLPVELIHVNYHLRGEDSNLDEIHVRKLAESTKTQVHVKSIDLKAQLNSGGNLQQLAREERYNFFEELLKGHSESFVLLGHHREDQTETFFLNLARKAGIMGLASMPEKRDKYLRPLLEISKQEIIAYAESNQITWREDQSNQSSKYKRNKLRNELLPKLREAIPTLDSSVSLLSKTFQKEQLILESRIQELKTEIVKSQQLPLKTFQRLSEFEKIELCRQLEQPFGILDTWNTLNHKGTRIPLNKSKDCPFDILVHDGSVFTFILEEQISMPKIIVEGIDQLPKSFNKNEIYLDAAKIKGSLTLRKPKTGDRIQPIGMKGSKLISDVISDAKLDSLDKDRVVVLTDEAHILWIYGLTVSRRAIANEESTEILKINLLFE